MTRLFFAVLVLFATTVVAGDVATYGEELGDTDVVAISALYETPDDYVGKTVKVEGRVIGVCAKRGCWMELASDEEFQSLRIKVTDGVIVFPMEAKGQMAVAEGVFTRIEIPAAADPGHSCAKEHEGAEHAEAEHSSCQPSSAYMVMGTGAEIRPAKADAR